MRQPGAHHLAVSIIVSFAILFSERFHPQPIFSVSEHLKKCFLPPESGRCHKPFTMPGHVKKVTGPDPDPR